MPGFPECVNPFLASQPWGAEPPPLQWALGRQEGCCAGESGSSLFSVPPGSRDSLAQGALGFPWAEALGQIGSALGDRMLQRPPWPQGKLWRGRTAHLPDLEPCQRQAWPPIRAWVLALSPQTWHPLLLGGKLALVWLGTQPSSPTQRPHYAHPSDPLGGWSGSTVLRGPPLDRTMLQARDLSRIGAPARPSSALSRLRGQFGNTAAAPGWGPGVHAFQQVSTIPEAPGSLLEWEA